MKKRTVICLALILCMLFFASCVQKTIEYVYVEVTPTPAPPTPTLTPAPTATPTPMPGRTEKPAVPTLSPAPQLPESYELPTPPRETYGPMTGTTAGLREEMAREKEFYIQEIDNTIRKICEYADQKGTEEYRIVKECVLQDQENWEAIKGTLLENISLKYKAVYALEGGGTGLDLSQSGEATVFYEQRLIEVIRMYAFIQGDLHFQAG